MSLNELYERAARSIIEADETACLKLIDYALDNNIDLLDLLVKGFGQGNEMVNDLFDKGDLSLPELIYSSDVMSDMTKTILDHLGKSEEEKKEFQYKKLVLIATVAGDIHDIGKGVVISTLKNAGYRVIDLGTEVSVDEIIENAERFGADVIATSALLTSSMKEQKKLEQALESRNLRGKYVTMVGGAPCTMRWARRIGADIYSEDAVDAVRTLNSLIDAPEGNDNSIR